MMGWALKYLLIHTKAGQAHVEDDVVRRNQLAQFNQLLSTLLSIAWSGTDLADSLGGPDLADIDRKPYEAGARDMRTAFRKALQGLEEGLIDPTRKRARQSSGGVRRSL